MTIQLTNGGAAIVDPELFTELSAKWQRSPELAALAVRSYFIKTKGRE